MQRALIKVNEQTARRGQAPIALHIGLNTGLAAAGNIGSDRCIQHATVGDTTNMASRICAAAQPGEIRIADSTRAKLPAARFELDPLRPLQIKGKDEPLIAHRVVWR